MGPVGAAGFGTWACESAAQAGLALAAAGLGTLVSHPVAAAGLGAGATESAVALSAGLGPISCLV